MVLIIVDGKDVFIMVRSFYKKVNECEILLVLVGCYIIF